MGIFFIKSVANGTDVGIMKTVKHDLREIEMVYTAKIRKVEYAEYINEITLKICRGKCFEVVAELPVGTVWMHFPKKAKMLEWLDQMYGIYGDNITWEAA